jgi:hypothetical protein
VPRAAGGHGDQGIWSELLISGAIASGAALVADSYRSVRWLGSGKTARAVSFD